MSPDPLTTALAEAGGIAAPAAATAQLRGLLDEELAHARAELGKARSGRVTVAFAPGGLAVLAADPRLRADPGAVTERTFLVAAAAVGALIVAGGDGERLEAGGEEHLALRAPGADPELATLALEEQRLDRVRLRALAVPEAAIRAGDLRPLAPDHPLAIAARVAALGGDPTDPASLEAHEETVLAAARPHDDPDPVRRIARRILQRMDGMGKWGGYHTEFVHLARGFGGNDRAQAFAVGEALIDAGLLVEKQSVGQRHVFLNPRRAGDIHRLIETGETPTGLSLPPA